MFKAPEPPCSGLGCGDNVSQQLGAEKRALLFRRYPNNTTCRRLQSSKSARKANPIPVSGDLKKCRRATSLEDLSPKRQEVDKPKRRRATQMPSSTLTMVNTSTIHAASVCLKNVPRTTLAARQVCHILMLNAWRKRRNDVQEYKLTIKHLENQVDNLSIQTIVLRKLLDSEKERVGQSQLEVQQMTEQMEESIRERNAIKAEKGELEKEITRLEDCIAERQTKCQNVKNDFLAAQSEVSMLEKQLGKERDKLLKLREDKKHLLDKIHTNEELLATKNITIEHFQACCRDLETKLTSEIEQRRKAEAESQESRKAIQRLEMKHKKLEEALKTVTEKSQQLSVKIEMLESLLDKREQQNNTLQITIQDQQIEIRALQERRSQLETSWGARAMDIATMFARLPFSILRNMAVIFLPQNN